MLERLGLCDSSALDFGPSNFRDALRLGDCDAGVTELASLLGWSEELAALLDHRSEGTEPYA